jgi:rhodanese-related sulfurtransferase
MIKGTKTKLPDPKKAKAYFENQLSFNTSPVKLKRMMTEGTKFNLIDVRSAEHYGEGHIPGAISAPREVWGVTKALKKNMLNVLYCSNPGCLRSAEAAAIFAGKGYPVVKLEGGFEDWRDHGFDIEMPAEMLDMDKMEAMHSPPQTDMGQTHA